MHSDKQDYLQEDRDKIVPLKEALYDSLEEDNSDNFSTDSLEYQKEKEDREERLLVSEKHRKEGPCSTEKKVEGISERESPNECYKNTDIRTTTVPFYKREVTVAQIQKTLENDCKANIRTKIEPTTTANFTKQRKHPVKGLFKKGCPSIKSDYKGSKSFLSQWLIQANACNNSQIIEKDHFKSDGNLCSLMKDLSLTGNISRRRPAGSSCSEDDIAFSKTSRITAQQSLSSLVSENRKDHVLGNKINCSIRKKEPVSYLQNYRERKYGLYKVQRRPSPEGSSCSTYGNNSTLSINSEEDRERISCGGNNDNDDEYSFYMKVIVNGKLRDETAKPFASNSESALTQAKKTPKKKIIIKPRDLKDVPIMDHLGPKHVAINEKLDKRTKQNEYGNSVSRRNILSLKTRQIIHKKTNMENPSGPPEASLQNSRRQRVKGRKASAGQSEQNNKQQRLERRDASDRAKGKRIGNSKQEVRPSGDLLETLQKRHLEEVAKAEIIRQQMK